MTGHLGPRVSALVDDALDAEERDRALAHLARCATCRAAVDQERRTKAVVRALPAPQPSPRLIADLHRMADPGGPLPAEHSRGRVPTTGWRRAPGASTGRDRRAPAGRADSIRPAWAPRPRSRARLGARTAAATSAVALAATLGLAALGAPSTRPPTATVVPRVDDVTTEHVTRTGGMPFGDAGVVLPVRSEPDTDR